MAPADNVALPVIVVAGVARDAKRRLVGDLLQARPAGARWAVLDNAADAGPAGATSDVRRFPVPGGCACCSAGPAFRTALVRLLRAGPWQRLLVDVDPSGHAHAVVDQLRSPPFDGLLRVARLLVPVPASGGSVVADAAGRGAAASLEIASDFLLIDDANDAALATARAALARAGPWPRVRVAGEDRRQSPADRRTAQADDAIWQTGIASAIGPDWDVFSAVPPAALAGDRLLIRRWDGAAVAQRRPMLEFLESLVAAPDIAGFVALVRTPRAWYRWAWGRIEAAEPLGLDQAAFTEAETRWRLDSRLVVSLAQGADRGRAGALLAPLAGVFDPA